MLSGNGDSSLILFVTGRLAESSLREVLSELAQKIDIRYEVAVPGIQVAALLHTDLLLKRLQVSDAVERVIVPGWCQGDLQILSEHFGKPFERGPKDLRDLPEYFGLGKRRQVSLDRYSIEIIGEINHATRQTVTSVAQEALAMTASGADVIDVGCVPGESSPAAVSAIVHALRSEGLRVSIDSFDPYEVEAAVRAGAELILSCSHLNVDWVTRLGTEVVAIPDTPDDMESLTRLVERLASENVRFRIDPIIEPVGMGFAASLERYMRVRRLHPNAPMMMGVGNVTELAEVDSAGVNLILAAVCEELGIQSVLTTQVINWCRSAVAEFDAARRLVHYAVANRVIPKHLSSALVMLRDPQLKARSPEVLKALANSLTDANYRIYADNGELHLMNRAGYWKGTNPFDLFSQAVDGQAQHPDVGHAFYLGYELARAEIALHLGKQYEQDEPIRWGLLGDSGASSSVTHRPDAGS